MSAFVAMKSETHSTDIAMLRGARLVTRHRNRGGPRPGQRRRSSRSQVATGITARFMRRDNFTFSPSFKLFIVGNHMPVLANVDDAARRRFNIVPFTRQPQRPDRDLEAKLQHEWPSILRWMIDGCLDWQRPWLGETQKRYRGHGRLFRCTRRHWAVPCRGMRRGAHEHLQDRCSERPLLSLGSVREGLPAKAPGSHRAFTGRAGEARGRKTPDGPASALPRRCTEKSSMAV